MKYKMIVTDLDRTLLHTDKTISDYSYEVLRQCQAMGIKIVFATARPRRTVMPYLSAEKLQVDALIVHNGAIAYAGDVCVCKNSIAVCDRDVILQAAARLYPHATLSVEMDDVLYANFDVSVFWNETDAVRTDFSDLSELPNTPADKIIIGSLSSQEYEKINLLIPESLYIETSSGETMNLELIMNRHATKQNALKIVAELFNMDFADIVAFGDDYNDISMLRACGTGVAVHNAIPDVQQAANEICASNNDDGVASWLDAHVLDFVRMRCAL